MRRTGNTSVLSAIGRKGWGGAGRRKFIGRTGGSTGPVASLSCNPQALAIRVKFRHGQSATGASVRACSARRAAALGGAARRGAAPAAAVVVVRDTGPQRGR